MPRWSSYHLTCWEIAALSTAVKTPVEIWSSQVTTECNKNFNNTCMKQLQDTVLFVPFCCNNSNLCCTIVDWSKLFMQKPQISCCLGSKLSPWNNQELGSKQLNYAATSDDEISNLPGKCDQWKSWRMTNGNWWSPIGFASVLCNGSEMCKDAQIKHGEPRVYHDWWVWNQATIGHASWL